MLTGEPKFLKYFTLTNPQRWWCHGFPISLSKKALVLRMFYSMDAKRAFMTSDSVVIHWNLNFTAAQKFGLNLVSAVWSNTSADRRAPGKEEAGSKTCEHSHPDKLLDSMFAQLLLSQYFFILHIISYAPTKENNIRGILQRPQSLLGGGRQVTEPWMTTSWPVPRMSALTVGADKLMLIQKYDVFTGSTGFSLHLLKGSDSQRSYKSMLSTWLSPAHDFYM